ncbi:hypothetical protein ACJJTC_012401 [Scirpophaga incertulas]
METQKRERSANFSTAERQEMYRTGGGPSNAPEFNDIEEKVLSICSNIKGMDARNDSDNITTPIEIEDVIIDTNELLDVSQISFANTPEQQETGNTDQATVKIPENKWNKWHPKTLKTKVSNVLRTDTASKTKVISKLDQLSAARLELVKLQMETAKKEQQFIEEQHKLKMLHLANDERRKEEIHALLIHKLRCGPVSNDMIIDHTVI